MKTITITQADSANLEYFKTKQGQYKLLGTSSYKIDKSNKSNKYRTAIVYLSPSDSVQGINLCPMAYIADCRNPCLNYAGRGAMNSTQAARVRKTKLLRDYPNVFWNLLDKDIKTFTRSCKRNGLIPVVRINGTSDIVIERKAPWILSGNPEVQFYDYTKIHTRDVSAHDNYHLTLSYSGANDKYAADVIESARKSGNNLAVVFSGDLPDTWHGMPVITGDNDDMRWLDPNDQTYVIGLSAKGKAKQDQSGFVVRAA